MTTYPWPFRYFFGDRPGWFRTCRSGWFFVCLLGPLIFCSPFIRPKFGKLHEATCAVRTFTSLWKSLSLKLTSSFIYSLPQTFLSKILNWTELCLIMKSSIWILDHFTSLQGSQILFWTFQQLFFKGHSFNSNLPECLLHVSMIAMAIFLYPSIDRARGTSKINVTCHKFRVVLSTHYSHAQAMRQSG